MLGWRVGQQELGKEGGKYDGVFVAFRGAVMVGSGRFGAGQEPCRISVSELAADAVR